MLLNMTQHDATPEQKADGVVDIPDMEVRKLVRRVLTFEELPTQAQIEERAELLATVVQELGYRAALIGGAPYLMPELEQALTRHGILPCYSFSIRESTEKVSAGGNVRKITVFRHLGLIEKIRAGTFWGGDDTNE